MKAITYLAAFSLNLAALTAPALAAETAGWTTNLEEAFESAKKDKKSVLIEFTGSDWCPPCIAMHKNVFSKKEFVEAAKAKFHLVKLDFPQADQATAKKNEPYAEKYKVDAFPTILLLTPEGKEFSRFIASEYPKTDLFLAHINQQLEKKDLD